MVFDQQRRGLALDHVLRDHALADLALGGDLVHHVEHHLFKDGAQAPRASLLFECLTRHRDDGDRKSTRLNSSHGYISYAVFCLKKKKIIKYTKTRSSKGPSSILQDTNGNGGAYSTRTKLRPLMSTSKTTQ